MFKNYFKIAWRNMMRSKGYSALNILGLATGMAVALLIGLWVQNEYSFDKFLPGYQQIYQVRRNFNSNGDTLNFSSASLKLADALRREVPEFEYISESLGIGNHGLMVGNKKFYIRGGVIQGDFLKMFPYPLEEGSAAYVLKDPYSIVITRSTARALFGEENPLNKTVRFDNEHDLKVTGILKDIPANSTLQFDFLVPFSYAEATQQWIRNARGGSYDWNSFNIYARLKPGISAYQVASKIRDIEKTEKGNTNAMNSAVALQPIWRWHLYDNYENGKEKGRFLDYVRMFSLIGSLVLLIACINFVNLTTARSEKRAKEVGVRKAIGSQKKDLIFQFLLESVLLCFFAFLLCMLMTQLVLPAFNSLTGGKLVIPYSSWIFWILMLAGVLIVSLASGIRPAFYLSSIRPARVLKGAQGFGKGAQGFGKGASWPRKVLVSIQFSCSVALIISTIIVYRQIQYAKNRPTGYTINRLMTTFLDADLDKNYTALRNELLQKRVVESMTRATSPSTEIYWHSDADWPGKNPGETVEMASIIVGEDYFNTLGIPLQYGRNFTGINDTASVIFNEAAIRRMRLKQPLSQLISWQGLRLRIVGVVKDVLMNSPYDPAEPTLFYCQPGGQNVIIYRLSPQIKTQDAIAELTSVFNKYDPTYPYSYEFADADYAAKFKIETLVGKLSGIFAGLAIFISCLGLFGLAAYVAEQRTREIGIRKVLGASVLQVWLLLSSEFIGLVLISCVIATPVAFYFLHGWLQKYAYRINIGAWVFVIASALALLITLVTISFQAIRAAVANPVDSLRSE